MQRKILDELLFNSLDKPIIRNKATQYYSSVYQKSPLSKQFLLFKELKTSVIDDIASENELTSEDMNYIEERLELFQIYTFQLSESLNNFKQQFDNFKSEEHRDISSSGLMVLGIILFLFLTIIIGIVLMILSSNNKKQAEMAKNSNLTAIAFELKKEVEKFNDANTFLSINFGICDNASKEFINKSINSINATLSYRGLIAYKINSI